MNDIRATVIDIIRQMPPEADLDDIIEELYFRARVDQALQEVRDGKSIPHEEVKSRLDLA